MSTVSCRFTMEAKSGARPRKVSPQCNENVHIRRAVCGCGYCFPSKSRAWHENVLQMINVSDRQMLELMKGDSQSSNYNWNPRTRSGQHLHKLQKDYAKNSTEAIATCNTCATV